MTLSARASTACGVVGVVGFVAACVGVSAGVLGDHGYVAALATSFFLVFVHFRPRLADDPESVPRALPFRALSRPELP